ncbi:MAG TPA: hypothetical protein VGR35_11995 [Tepidisphaeraceae bacterium]|nr:hypothetical protein [Tepidisphaeraceae bacterium]
MPVTFTSEAATRIAAAVRRVEGTPQDRSGEPISAGPTEGEFYAWITSSTDATGMRYSWVRVYPDFTGHDPDLMFETGMKWRLHTPHAAGFDTAYEANGRRGITDKIVRLSFAGFRDDEVPDSDPPAKERVPVYVFVHETLEPDGFLPPHDHRSNEPQHGGFAFACYAPGTALPQMPWYI